MVVAVLCTVVPVLRADDQTAEPGAGKVVMDAVGPMALVRSAAGAGISHLQNTPSEWGQGSVGYGRRVASAFGGHIVKTAIKYPLARLFHEEFGYRRSGKQGFKARLMYALIATVYVHKTDSARLTIAKSEIAGSLGSGLISRLWQPASTRAISHGFMSAGIGLAADAGGNVFREFWPEIRHSHRHAVKTPQPAPGS